MLLDEGEHVLTQPAGRHAGGLEAGDALAEAVRGRPTTPEGPREVNRPQEGRQIR